jgi:molecular chaperone GrpE
MFFKKKKIMSDTALNDQNAINENTDNLSQEEDITDETLTNDENQDFAEEEKNDTENETIEKLKTELNEAKDKYVRLVAEFDNFRKRNARERIELSQTAGKDIIQSLLVVLDDSSRAAKQMETSTDMESVKQGISLVFNKLQNILQQKGLKIMDSKNQTFNPDLHEAITEIPAPNEDMVGKVIDVVEDGYYLNDKLIRHAKVVVGK